jgi:hypothetical protein
MVIRVVDNKKLLMTVEESALYDRIVSSYTNTTNNGKDLFQDLFETDDNGIIRALIPPSKKRTSFEVWIFLVNLFVSQHTAIMYEQAADVATQFKAKMAELDKKIAEVDQKLKRLDKKKGE